MASKDGKKQNPSQLFNFAKDSYLERTSRPFYALVFLLPFIIFYELGTIFINTDLLNQSQIRVVAFVWLQTFLQYLGFADKITWAAPAIAVVIILLALQIVSRKQWYFSFPDILPMALECIALAIPLIVLSVFLNNPAQSQTGITAYKNTQTQIISCSAQTTDNASTDSIVYDEPTKTHNLWADITTSIGAGIYEELIFRLILICLLMILFQDILRLNRKNAVIFSVIFSAAMFSAHHHIDFFSGQTIEHFNATAFAFRTIAGIYFAALFAFRGFAITAGTHAFYDIIVVFINAFFINP